MQPIAPVPSEPAINLSGRLARWLAAAMAVALLGALRYWLHVRSLEAALVHDWPDELTRRPHMVRFAVSMARPLYAAHCLSCHGVDLHGNHGVGAPDLTDSVWL